MIKLKWVQKEMKGLKNNKKTIYEMVHGHEGNKEVCKITNIMLMQIKYNYIIFSYFLAYYFLHIFHNVAYLKKKRIEWHIYVNLAYADLFVKKKKSLFRIDIIMWNLIYKSFEAYWHTVVHTNARAWQCIWSTKCVL